MDRRMQNIESSLKIQEKEPMVKIDVYSIDHNPDNETAKGISIVFLDNYPDMYSEELRLSDFTRYDSSEKIQQQVRVGNFFITATIDNKVIGMTKFRQERRTDTPDCEEWLGSWIMVDKPYRKFGIAEKLFIQILEELRRIKNISGKRTFFVADVHKNNAPSISLCTKMGCSKELGKSKEYLLFRKEIEPKA